MKFNYDKTSFESIAKHSYQFINKSLSDILNDAQLSVISEQIRLHGKNRKGLLGDLVEEYLYDIENNSNAAADFPDAGVELKVTPLKKHAKKKYVAKERLVFSMINYMNVVNEEWETSSFLEKNKLLLLMFYLYEQDIDITKYKFKLIHILNLLSHISNEDILQIKKDWQTIIDKIKVGDAHLLSEGDTLYLGAATKASKATDRRPQPFNDEPAKPRAFSFKPAYMNFLIEKFLGKEDKDNISLFENSQFPKTIEENIRSRFKPYMGRTNLDIEKELNISYYKRPKNHRRLLLNKLLGASSNKIIELDKADITLRVIALEPSGVLKESISFPKFDYITIVNETWEESDFYEQLSTKRFLFIVFKKHKDGYDVLEKIQFWNFPMEDMDKAKWVWEETVNRIKNKKADKLPGLKDSIVAHVRPHGRDGKDTAPTGYGTEELKKSFWLNAKYIENEIKGQ